MAKIRKRGRSAPFPLLELPGELRNRIYEHYFSMITFSIGRGPKKPESSPNSHKLAILRTCRQIYSETNLLAHRFSTFSISDYIDLIIIARVLPYGSLISSLRIVPVLAPKDSSTSTYWGYYTTDRLHVVAAYFPFWLTDLNNDNVPRLASLKRIHLLAPIKTRAKAESATYTAQELEAIQTQRGQQVHDHIANLVQSTYPGVDVSVKVDWQ